MNMDKSNVRMDKGCMQKKYKNKTKLSLLHGKCMYINVHIYIVLTIIKKNVTI